MGKISAAIVSYGGYEEVMRAVESLLKYAGPDFTLWLVDNASPDGTGEKLEKSLRDPRVRVIRNPQNYGFGKGHNTVIPMLDSEYHFVLNPDILVNQPVLEQMAGWMDQNPDVVMSTPRLTFPDGRPQVLPKRPCNLLGLLSRQLPSVGFLKPYGDHYAMLDEDLSKVTDIQFCTGSFFCMRTGVFREMGGFDEGYFMYVEDADITRKAMKYGRVCYLPQFTACHAWHRSPNKDLSHFWMQLKSMGRYFRKWGFRLK